MRRQEVSIADIARSAGVSHTTVSRALRESPLISPDTRGRIQRIAREMGYTPNALAQSLQTQRTSTIGLVVTTIADPFFSDVVKGVEGVAREAGFSVFFGASHNEPEQEMVLIDTFHRRRVDGILIASSRVTNYEQRLDHIRVPTVLINSQAQSQHKLLYRVAVNDYLGAQMAVEHLLQLGHRAIGYLGIQSRPYSNQQRLSGYQTALRAAGVEWRDDWIMIAPTEEASSGEDVNAGRELLTRLLDAGVTAVFCYNDMMAIGGLMACREQQIALPETLSIVGFDDVNAASFVTPQLTTIRQPKVQLGQLAMNVLLDLLDGRSGQDHILAPQLIVRNSTAPYTHS
jgi:LacI family transcriptional regulator/LacI family repressor for deo operon, udp, cdd, tsx, nupC, and nupG